MRKLLHSRVMQKFIWRLFPVFQAVGIHVLPVHYYSPIPDGRELRKKRSELLFEDPMYGITMNDDNQLQLLQLMKTYEDDYIRAGKNTFGLQESSMTSYAPINALALYSMIRSNKPELVIEIGAGMSTRISAAAMLENSREGSPGEFIVIEPYPDDAVRDGIEGINILIQDKVENLDASLFKRLKTNDILFIDSSHTVKPLGDVNFLFFSIIPQLNPGVFIHIHDIFFPVNYLPHHFFNSGRKMFWQEQYLLQAFLMFNQEYEILLSLSYLHFKHQLQLHNLFDWYSSERWPSSFWMKRAGD